MEPENVNVEKESPFPGIPFSSSMMVFGACTSQWFSDLVRYCLSVRLKGFHMISIGVHIRLRVFLHCSTCCWVYMFALVSINCCVLHNIRN